MIVARSLSRKFGRFLAVDSLDFHIDRGRVVGFLGPNGAGKTTTIRMIAGYLPPTAGTVEVDGLDVVRAGREVHRRIGYLPEAAPLYSEMRVDEFLKFRARLFGIERSKRRRAIDLALRRCSLDEVRTRPIHQLSKGFRQRVGLAAALLHQPPVLILDEPTVGLDPAQIREVRALIRELAGNHTILLSTHILPEVELTCDQIIMMARGRIRAQGTISQLQQTGDKTPRYLLETNSSKPENAIREMKGVADVQSVVMDEHWRRVTVVAVAGTPDLREPLAATVAKMGCSVRELHREAASLEHLFVQMIADAEAHAAESDGGRQAGQKGEEA
ncbi:MAG: ABC transporter ATP-binding protein [Phycisphaerales bacterium]|nr:ABC transporter ATP-binding protein [Phycisphaerales bacterium]